MAINIQMSREQIEILAKALVGIHLAAEEREEAELLAGCARQTLADPDAEKTLHGWCL